MNILSLAVPLFWLVSAFFMLQSLRSAARDYYYGRLKTDLLAKSITVTLVKGANVHIDPIRALLILRDFYESYDPSLSSPLRAIEAGDFFKPLSSNAYCSDALKQILFDHIVSQLERPSMMTFGHLTRAITSLIRKLYNGQMWQIGRLPTREERWAHFLAYKRASLARHSKRLHSSDMACFSHDATETERNEPLTDKRVQSTGQCLRRIGWTTAQVSLVINYAILTPICGRVSLQELIMSLDPSLHYDRH